MTVTESDLIGQHGRIIGDHPWAGKSGTIVRIENTLIGYGAVVKLDDASDVPPGQECFIFDGRKEWRPTARTGARARPSREGEVLECVYNDRDLTQ
jgi:hypothetical protein